MKNDTPKKTPRSANSKPEQKRRRFLGRSDGRRIRTLPPISRVSPYIMKTRTGASNYISDCVEISNMERYIKQKRNEGLVSFGALHVFIAAYVRTVSQRPAINRFISGQKIHSRYEIEIALTIKKEMTLDSPDTVIKAVFLPTATSEDVYAELNRLIAREKDKTGDASSFDKAAGFFNYIPGLFLKFAVWLLSFLDYFGLIPAGLLKVSPFHASLVITSMGSLGIPPVYHHLYNFGNVPILWAFGAKRSQLELTREGTVAEKKYIDYRLVCDERICDGYYYASALKYAKKLLHNPFRLSQPPGAVIPDID